MNTKTLKTICLFLILFGATTALHAAETVILAEPVELKTAFPKGVDH